MNDTTTIGAEFLFDSGSPNAYLCQKVLASIEARTGKAFVYCRSCSAVCSSWPTTARRSRPSRRSPTSWPTSGSRCSASSPGTA